MNRPCITCGRLTTATRCPPCEQTRQRTRNAKRGDRYGAQHRRLRKAWGPLVARGIVPCARCNEYITDQQWDLDHLPDGSERPSHAQCNRAHTGGAGRQRDRTTPPEHPVPPHIRFGRRL